MEAGLFLVSSGLALYHWGKVPKSQMHDIMGDWWLPYALIMGWMGWQCL